ncbi:hypothetical protein J4H56_18380 [Vibrio alginolyticus]|uniref:hypothetical protein n=1 Tax=Vibrio alginolyticus TaxID=663 RepID=UPI001BD6A674|nr:hypothetical protein [Vibrio alginolyticus]MBS9884537.1 hypothetical protein [Vibrio alginolyticus]
MNIQQLIEDVSQFRTAIERLKASDVEVSLFGFKESFPRAQCMTASQLLAHRLRDIGYKQVAIFLGDNSRDGLTDTHAWVTVGQSVVDITIDQFSEYSNIDYYVGSGLDVHTLYADGQLVSFQIDEELLDTYSAIMSFTV